MQATATHHCLDNRRLVDATNRRDCVVNRYASTLTIRQTNDRQVQRSDDLLSNSNQYREAMVYPNETTLTIACSFFFP
jgi:hypothetical protein